MNNIELLPSCIGKMVTNCQFDIRDSMHFRYIWLYINNIRFDIFATCKYDLYHSVLLSVTQVDNLLTIAKFSVADGIGFNGRTALLLFDKS